jgi:hypothetical protein
MSVTAGEKNDLLFREEAAQEKASPVALASRINRVKVHAATQLPF